MSGLGFWGLVLPLLGRGSGIRGCRGAALRVVLGLVLWCRLALLWRAEALSFLTPVVVSVQVGLGWV